MILETLVLPGLHRGASTRLKRTWPFVSIIKVAAAAPEESYPNPYSSTTFLLGVGIRT
jgi:hypothetical protein